MKHLNLLTFLLVFALMGCTGDMSANNVDDDPINNPDDPDGPTTPIPVDPDDPWEDPIDIDEEDDTNLPPCPEDAYAMGPRVFDESPIESTVFYVRVNGDDEADGMSPSTAFASIQQGVDALQSGDTLLIGPGEYFGNVRREEELGNDEVITTIRAEIPGTVLLRGDIPAPELRPLDGFDFVYVGELDGSLDVQAINEVSSLVVLERVPSLSEVEVRPGVFFQDRDADRIYVSSSDRQSVERHHYRLGVVPTHGFYLRNANQVVVDGLTVTGFHTATEIDRRDRTANSVWGIFVTDSRRSIIRRSHAYLNGRGIGINSTAEGAYENVIEHSIARANMSIVGGGYVGGLTILEPQRDIIQDSVAYLNGNYGIKIRGGGTDGQLPEHQSFMRRNLAWGNGATDYKIKTGHSNLHRLQHSVGLATLSNTNNSDHNLFGWGGSFGEDTIVLEDEGELDLYAEFADPDNFDFRLQSGSRFRGAHNGEDRGPYTYAADVYFVSPSGDDANDGLSSSEAFATLAHALSVLAAGDTLYLLPGAYAGDVDATILGGDDAPIAIRAHGREPARVEGRIQLRGQDFAIERVHFADTLTLNEASQVKLTNTAHFSETIGLNLISSNDITVTHGTFRDFTTAAVSVFESHRVTLLANIFDNARGVGVRVDNAEAILVSDYNNFARPTRAWIVDRGVCGLSLARQTFETHSMESAVAFEAPLSNSLSNPHELIGRSHTGRTIGNFYETLRRPQLMVTQPARVHSVSATTANIEWSVSAPATTHFAWGDTEETENEDRFEALYYANFSFTGLQPDTTYHFRITRLSIPNNVDLDLEPVDVEGPLLSFTTLAEDPASRTLYVSEGGDDASDGLSMENAFATVQRAADSVRPGDTVFIAGGTYYERVVIKVTGTAERPITFRNAPGERVNFDGDDKSLGQTFVIAAKEHLNFDGFFLDNYHSRNAFSIASTSRWDSW